MSKSSNANKTNNEQVKMKKYIVEAPEPKEGQKVSSGGIREKGKMIAAFRNPVPYEEQVRNTQFIPLSSIQPVDKRDNSRLHIEAGKYLLSFVWHNFGEPVVGAWLKEKGREIADSIAMKSRQIHESTIIDVEGSDIKDVEIEDKNVIQHHVNCDFL